MNNAQKQRTAIAADIDDTRERIAQANVTTAELRLVRAAMAWRDAGGRGQADLLDACDAVARARDGLALCQRRRAVMARAVPRD